MYKAGLVANVISLQDYLPSKIHCPHTASCQLTLCVKWLTLGLCGVGCLRTFHSYLPVAWEPWGESEAAVSLSPFLSGVGHDVSASTRILIFFPHSWREWTTQGELPLGGFKWRVLGKERVNIEKALLGETEWGKERWVCALAWFQASETKARKAKLVTA